VLKEKHRLVVSMSFPSEIILYIFGVVVLELPTLHGVN